MLPACRLGKPAACTSAWDALTEAFAAPTLLSASIFSGEGFFFFALWLLVGDGGDVLMW